MRKMISFKIENLTAKEREIIDRWADEQTNIQQSLANIVMHVVRYAGYTDVMDFDTQRKLHTIFANDVPVVEQVEQKTEANIEPASTVEKEVTKQPTNDVFADAADLFD